jgi:RHS repeat-associated protein
MIATSSSGVKAPPTYNVEVFDSLVLKNAQGPGSNATNYEDDDATEHVYLNAAGELLGHVFDAPSLPSAAGNVHMFMPLGDRLGSTSFVIDHDTGELVEAQTYQAYGAVETDFRPQRWNYFREDVRYTGHWDDAEVGLVYMNARYYSPQLGRFISPDPLTIHGLAGDGNPYAYVRGSPMGLVDPFGLCPDDPLGKECPPKSSSMGSGGDLVIGGLVVAAAGAAAGIVDWLASGKAGRDVGNAGSDIGDAISAATNAIANGANDISNAFSNCFGLCGGGSPPPAAATLAPTLLRAIGNSLLASNLPLSATAGFMHGIQTAADPNASTGARVFSGVTSAAAMLPALGDLAIAAEAAEGASTLFTAADVGPLPAAIANTFRGGSYTATTLSDATTLYRAYGGTAGQLGSFWTRVAPAGPLQATMDLALSPAWGNTAAQVARISVPAGTTIFEGAAAGQGALLGGGSQVFIPAVEAAWLLP